MFGSVDGRTDAGVTGIIKAHLRAFGSGELKRAHDSQNPFNVLAGDATIRKYKNQYNMIGWMELGCVMLHC